MAAGDPLKWADNREDFVITMETSREKWEMSKYIPNAPDASVWLPSSEISGGPREEDNWSQLQNRVEWGLALSPR